ncbi:MAG: type II toxin-antitoxin system HipA family toxin, partial [Bacteroidota bacterium]
MNVLNVCPGTLAEGYTSYSPICLKNMFDGRKVSHILTYKPPVRDEEIVEKFIENRKRISISGMQEKLSF